MFSFHFETIEFEAAERICRLYIGLQQRRMELEACCKTLKISKIKLIESMAAFFTTKIRSWCIATTF